jgi:hypothetical protein
MTEDDMLIARSLHAKRLKNSAAYQLVKDVEQKNLLDDRVDYGLQTGDFSLVHMQLNFVLIEEVIIKFNQYDNDDPRRKLAARVVRVYKQAQKLGEDLQHIAGRILVNGLEETEKRVAAEAEAQSTEIMLDILEHRAERLREEPKGAEIILMISCLRGMRRADPQYKIILHKTELLLNSLEGND